MITAVFSLWMVQNMLTTAEDNQLTTLSGQYKSELQKLLGSPTGLNDEVAEEVFPMNALLPSVLEKPAHVYHNVRADGRTFRIGWFKMGVCRACTSRAISGGVAGYLIAGRAMKPIANAIQRQEQFTSDASRELRTPLSIMRSAYEVLDEERDNLPRPSLHAVQ